MQCRVKQSVAADAECATRKSPVKLTSERSLKYIDKSGVRKSTVALSDEDKISITADGSSKSDHIVGISSTDAEGRFAEYERYKRRFSISKMRPIT